MLVGWRISDDSSDCVLVRPGRCYDVIHAAHPHFGHPACTCWCDLGESRYGLVGAVGAGKRVQHVHLKEAGQPLYRYGFGRVQGSEFMILLGAKLRLSNSNMSPFFMFFVES